MGCDDTGVTQTRRMNAPPRCSFPFTGNEATENARVLPSTSKRPPSKRLAAPPVFSGLRFDWILEIGGSERGSGTLPVPGVPARTSVVLALPGTAGLGGLGDGERWLTVRARLASDTLWAGAGHVVAVGQVRLDGAEAGLTAGSPAGPPPIQMDPFLMGSQIQIGPAVFDSRTGSLLRIGTIPVLASPRLDLWRPDR